MKNLKKLVACLLALVMCLSLAACGGDDSGDGDVAPAAIEDLVMDDSVECDYSGFWGTWQGEDGSMLLVEEYNERTRFELDGTDDELLASGELQYVEEYGYVYAYNEHDGFAHQCWFDEYNALHIDEFGTFTKVSGDLPGENIGDEADYVTMAGSWYLDGAADAVSSLEIDEFGNWTLYERPFGDGDPSEVDCGTISAGDVDGLYYAASTLFDDVVYDFTMVEDGVLYWGGEYDCYIKVA